MKPSNRASLAQSAKRLSNLNSNLTNACTQVCGWNSLAAMLAAKSSAGVTPEVNLRNLLQTGDEARKQGNPPWLWNPGQMSPEVQNKTRVSVAPQKGLVSSKIFFKIINKWNRSNEMLRKHGSEEIETYRGSCHAEPEPEPELEPPSDSLPIRR